MNENEDLLKQAEDKFEHEQLIAEAQKKFANSSESLPQSEDEKIVADYKVKQEKYGTPSQLVKTAVEGAGRGLTLGGSDYLLQLAGENPEDIRGRMEANPGVSFTGDLIGGAASGKAFLSPLAGAVGLSGIGAAAAEGAVFGSGNVVSDEALGDTKINAQKILTDIGIGAAFGGGLGLVGRGLGALGALKKGAAEGAESVAAKVGDDLISAEGALTKGSGKPPIVDAPIEAKTGISPTSLEDIQARVKEAGYRGETIEMPEKSALQDATNRVELLNPVHPLQVESLDSQSSRDLYKTAREMAGKEGEALRNYEALQKQELTKRTANVVDELVGDGKKAISDATEGGKEAIKEFTDHYNAEKESLKPLFKTLKAVEIPSEQHLPGLLGSWSKVIPGVADAFDTAGTKIKLKPYDSSMSIAKSTYSAVKEAVKALNSKKSQTFEGLWNIRKNLDQNINIMESGEGPAQIRSLKASMMDYLQSQLEKTPTDINVRDTFRRYAINEQQREVIHKAFGASVGSQEFGQLSKVKPELISDKVFRDTATTQAAKNILSDKAFKKILANHLAEQMEKVTVDGNFSSNKFGTYLKKNSDVLNEAFRDNPEVLQKIKDYNTISRVLPDSKSINPSGTAKTLWGILKAHSIPEMIANAKEYGAEKLGENLLHRQINNSLKGVQESNAKMNAIQRIIKKTDEKMSSGVKAIFNSSSRSSVKSGLTSGLTELTLSQYREKAEQIRMIANNEYAMMNHLDNNTADLYKVAPNITGQINNSLVAAAQFLNSKMPSPKAQMALSHEFVPTPAQLSKFNKYYSVVNNPLIVLDQVKNKTLTTESLEAIQAVHPDLYNDMKTKILDSFDSKKAKSLDYGTKISLAKFMGEPLDEHMLPQVALGYQASLSGPDLSRNAPQAQSPGKVTLGGMQGMTLGSRMSSSSQAIGNPDKS